MMGMETLAAALIALFVLVVWRLVAVLVAFHEIAKLKGRLGPERPKSIRETYEETTYDPAAKMEAEVDELRSVGRQGFPPPREIHEGKVDRSGGFTTPTSPARPAPLTEGTRKGGMSPAYQPGDPIPPRPSSPPPKQKPAPMENTSFSESAIPGRPVTGSRSEDRP